MKKKKKKEKKEKKEKTKENEEILICKQINQKPLVEEKQKPFGWGIFTTKSNCDSNHSSGSTIQKNERVIENLNNEIIIGAKKNRRSN